MGDHKRAGRQERKAVGIRELKAHAAGILRHVRESRASYVVTHRGRAIGLILPIEPDAPSTPSEDPTAAWDAFLRAGHRLEPQFQSGVSGVQLLSESRR